MEDIIPRASFPAQVLLEARALQVGRIASPETARQNLDLLGESAFPVRLDLINEAILDLLRHTRAALTPLWTACRVGRRPRAQDKRQTRKQGIGYTYKGFDGYFLIKGSWI